MTRPAPWKRSTAAERCANREAYKALKQRVEQSPETAKRRAEKAAEMRRYRANRKAREMAAANGPGSFLTRHSMTARPLRLRRDPAP